MQAIIVDDEPNGIGTLKKMLELTCPQVTVAATCSNALVARQKLEELSPDVVFLDIRMPGKSGLELLAELPEKNFEVIFVTAHNEYLLQALQCSAADYLLKPVDEDRLLEAMQRVELRMQQGKNSRNMDTLLHNLRHAGSPADMRLCLPTLKGFLIVKMEEIVYCEAERSYTVFHLAGNKPVTVSKPLLDYERLLGNNHFLRVHKSFLVNLQHVKEYQRGEGGVLIMSNGKEIEVSRRKKEYFLSKIKEEFRH
jgi:two-component system LytT family response regulator